MAVGIPGADSSVPFAGHLLDLARDFFGETPRFWGRYFKSPGIPGPAVYRPAWENGPLRANGLRVLPIAQQTGHVSSGADTGAEDGAGNAEAIVAAFGADAVAAQGGQFLVFLDVEGPPSLSADYFIGWASALRVRSRELSGDRFELLPCVYARTHDDATWRALRQAQAAGAPCFGAWVARLRNNACDQGFAEWDSGFCEPAFDLPFPVLLWQFAQDCPDGNGIDCDQTNPAVSGAELFLARLILPPEG
ncbi:MAG: hypothetical protein JO250_20585 [Armatimonadetes bacterium]|nr:hypothetical protein [Armatimonadota bacterium]